MCGFESTIDSAKCPACGSKNEIEPSLSNDSIKTSDSSVVVNGVKGENPEAGTNKSHESPNQSNEINTIPFGLEDAPFAPSEFGLPFDIDFAP